MAKREVSSKKLLIRGAATLRTSNEYDGISRPDHLGVSGGTASGRLWAGLWREAWRGGAGAGRGGPTSVRRGRAQLGSSDGSGGAGGPATRGAVSREVSTCVLPMLRTSSDYSALHCESRTGGAGAVFGRLGGGRAGGTRAGASGAGTVRWAWAGRAGPSKQLPVVGGQWPALVVGGGAQRGVSSKKLLIGGASGFGRGADSRVARGPGPSSSGAKAWVGGRGNGHSGNGLREHQA